MHGSRVVRVLLIHHVFPKPFRRLFHKVKKTVVRSKLSLVDLAGSERLAKTEATGDRLKEALHINKSLSALGDVIASLTSRKGHVPFRNSKLTHLLSDSLGADCKTLLFVNSSPAATNISESACSLMFASRARNVDLTSGGSGAAGAVARQEFFHFESHYVNFFPSLHFFVYILTFETINLSWTPPTIHVLHSIVYTTYAYVGSSFCVSYFSRS